MNVFKKADKILLITGAIAASGVSAQTPQGESVPTLLEELVVTAQRREQSIQDVPISVSVVTDKFIAENDIRSLQDLNGTVPGFYATKRSSAIIN